jgi:hypothetical protein
MSDNDYCESCGANLLLTGMQHNPNCSDTFALDEPYPPRMSSAYEWKLNEWKRSGAKEEEIFEAGPLRFNISRAKRIIVKAPRPVIRLPLEPFATLLEILVDLGPSIPGRDYNVTFPIIVATLKQGGKIPIDGWHRIDKALKLGLASIPTVILTVEETKVVRRK